MTTTSITICAYCRKAIEMRRDEWIHIQTSTGYCNPVFTQQSALSNKALPLTR